MDVASKQLAIQKKLEPPLEFFVAAQQNDIPTLRQQLSCDYDVNAKVELCGSRGSLLETACLEGHLEAAQELANAGADVNTRINFWNIGLLHYAAEKGHYNILNLLISSGGEVDQQDRSGVTPLMVASEKGHLDIVRLLIEAGADIEHEARYEPIPFAARRLVYSPAISESLLDQIQVYYTKNTPLMKACYANKMETVHELLKSGCDVNKSNEQGETAMHIAVKVGSVRLVERFIECCSTIDMYNEDGETPLGIAVHKFFEIGHFSKRGHVKAELFLQICKILIQSGASVEVKLGDSETILSRILTMGWKGDEDAQIEAYRSQLVHVATSAISYIPRNCLPDGHIPMQEVPVAYNNLLLWIKELGSKPRTLCHLARIAIRRTLSYGIRQSVRGLPLPESLQTYILLQS